MPPHMTFPPLEGKWQWRPSYLSRTYFKIFFFFFFPPIALHHFVFLNLPRACSSCSICYTVPFHLAAHLTWLSRWVKAKLHQSPVLVWSSNKLLLVPQIVFQA